jgi:hypothetical protein
VNNIYFYCYIQNVILWMAIWLKNVLFGHGLTHITLERLQMGPSILQRPFKQGGPTRWKMKIPFLSCLNVDRPTRNHNGSLRLPWCERVITTYQYLLSTCYSYMYSQFNQLYVEINNNLNVIQTGILQWQCKHRLNKVQCMVKLNYHYQAHI